MSILMTGTGRTDFQQGDARELFRSVERIEAVTNEDIVRVANEAFRPTNRTAALIVNEDS